MNETSTPLVVKLKRNQTYHYASVGVENLNGNQRGRKILIGGEDSVFLDQALECTLMAVSIAKLIGIKFGKDGFNEALPYSVGNDDLTFSAPYLSNLLNREVFFLRGWKDFASCVKGFNALGLISEQVLRTKASFEQKKEKDKDILVREFFYSRQSADGSSIKSDLIKACDIEGTEHELSVFVWETFKNRPIVCSTSSNMGIALHEIIDLLRMRRIRMGNYDYNILNKDEGSLIIWAPDSRADFMNHEKAEHLRSLESAENSTTSIHTYINRKERDPGAVKDAIATGGYFFPTNPQSKLELKSLLYNAIPMLLDEDVNVVDVIKQDEKLHEFLESLNVSFNEKVCQIEINQGVEGGIFGLMIPYFVMLEEMLQKSKISEHDYIEVWNQASIGAALAAAVLSADMLKVIKECRPHILDQLSFHFPNVSGNLESLGTLNQHVVGVFDLANIQSLAQLLGVVVKRHLSGKGTPFVGLGSSSYSNGNLCFDILQESESKNGVFQGKKSFFPSTHTVNFVSQALIFGEDLARYRNHCIDNDETVSTDLISNSVRKPEPAGATALTGIILDMLDKGQLTVFELAYTVRMFGFSRSMFISFCGFEGRDEGYNKICDLAAEEGPYMGQFMIDFLDLMEWPMKTLFSYVTRSREERGQISTVQNNPLSPLTVIYLTGDNTSQPGKKLFDSLLDEMETSMKYI